MRDSILLTQVQRIAAAGLALAGLLSTASAATIEEAVRLTLATNPQIGIVATNREQIDEELRQARGLYLPQVDVAAGIGTEWTNTTTTRTNGNGTVSLLRRDLSATFKQRVFDGFVSLIPGKEWATTADMRKKHGLDGRKEKS
mgnify:CR=1 FL=1